MRDEIRRLSREELEHEVLALRQAKLFRDAAAAKGRRGTDPLGEDHMHERNEDVARPPNGGPWWTRSVLVMGPIALIAVALSLGPQVKSWWGGNGYNGNGYGKEAVEKLDQHSRQTERMILILENLAQGQRENGVIQRRICRGVSKSDGAKEDCDR